MSLFDEPVVCPVQIGRDAQVDALERLAAEVAAGPGQVVLISGEAGIGKSRLTRGLAERLGQVGWGVLQGNCFERDRAVPYGPIAEMLRHQLGSPPPPGVLEQVGVRLVELARLLPELRPILPTELESAWASPEQDRRRLYQVVGEVLGDLDRFGAAPAGRGRRLGAPTPTTPTSPTLLIVEDAHWADDASLELLLRFARTLARRPVLVVLTYRSDEVDSGFGQFRENLDHERLALELGLAPLGLPDIEAMLQVTLGLARTPPRDLVELVSSLTEGNPFFIEELVRSLIADGQLARADGAWRRADPAAQVRVPRTVLATVQRRAEQLGAGARRTLELAAVVGQRVDFELLRVLREVPEAELLAQVKELISAGLIVEVSAERLAFRHALTRQAIYSQLLARERRRLHQRVADVLEGAHAEDRDASVAELAQHAYAAGLWAQALRDGRRAGELALAVYAPGAAVAHFTHALEAAAHLNTGAEPGLQRARGLAREALGDFEGARADYAAALAQADDPSLQWQAALDLGSLWAGRDYAQAGYWYERALGTARSIGDQRREARSLNRLGNWLVNIGQTTEGLALHREALRLLEALQDPAGVAETVDLLGMALGLHGDVVAAVQQFGRAVQDFRAGGNVPGLASSAASYLTFGAPLLAETSAAALRTLDETHRDSQEALRYAQQSGSLGSQAYAHFALAQALNGFGELGEALDHGLAARRIADQIEHQQWQAGACCVLGESYLFALAAQPAIEALSAGFDLARRLRSSWWTGIAASYLALAALLAGETARARLTLEAAWPRDNVPANASERRVAWVWGELALAEGNSQLALTTASALLDSAPGGTRGQGVPWLHKLAGEALLGLGRQAEALAALELARQGAVDRQQRPVLWQVHRASARAYLAAHAEDDAFAELARARAVVESLAATLAPELRSAMIERAEASLPHAPAAAARRAEAQKAGGLSVRERQVAHQVAQGLSNREIAQALVVGERTVETHVSSILAKLNLSSRRQIVAWVATRDLDVPPNV